MLYALEAGGGEVLTLLSLSLSPSAFHKAGELPVNIPLLDQLDWLRLLESRQETAEETGARSYVIYLTDGPRLLGVSQGEGG